MLTLCPVSVVPTTKPVAAVAAAVALPIAFFDYLENHAIAAMIETGAAGLTQELVAAASQWTILKSNVTMVAMTILLIGLAVRLGSFVIRIARSALSQRGGNPGRA